MTTTPALIYARRSVDRKDGTSLSIKGQVAHCREFAEAQGLDVQGAFTDSGISGAQWQRPGLDALLRAATPGSTVLVWDYDRLCRDNELLWHLVGMLRRREVRLRSVSQDYPDTPEGEFMVGIAGGMAAMERQRTAVRVRRWRRDYAQEGKTTGPAPYGYRRTGRGLIEPDPVTAPIVRLIFRFVLQGKGASAIATELERREIASPTGRTRWAVPVVQELLTRPTYAGYAAIRRRKPRPGEDWRAAWDFYPGKHKALISEEDFDAAQQLIQARRGHREQSPDGYPFLLVGTLRCHYCGGPMRGTYQYRRRRRYPRYSCSRRAHHRDCPHGQTIGAERTEAAFLTFLQALTDKGDRVREVHAVREDDGYLRQSLEGHLESIRRRKAALLRAVEEGYPIPRQAYAERQAELDREEQEAHAKLTGLDSQPPAALPPPTVFSSIAALFRSRRVALSRKRAAIRGTFSSLILAPDGLFWAEVLCPSDKV